MRTFAINQYDQWRAIARSLINDGTAPSDVQLIENNGQRSLFEESTDSETDPQPNPAFRVPRQFVSLAQTVSYHRDSGRWNLLYRILWRLIHGEPHLLEVTTDDDVLRVTKMEKQVRRDSHKMKAFVRFRKVVRDGAEFFVAWYQPDHRIVRRIAPFFSRRFAGMNWTILTPDESVSWDQRQLRYGEGVSKSEAPDFDSLEELWKTYYANIFNPARVKVKMMKSEMPVRFWKNLPEAETIDDLLQNAPKRVERMIEQSEGFDQTAYDYMTDEFDQPLTLQSLQSMSSTCQACDLYQLGSNTIFGNGSADAKIVLLAEQPDDDQDAAGDPFAGPSGELLTDALSLAGLEPHQVYYTFLVKHFKHTLVDGRETTDAEKRLYRKPNEREIRCCRPWFEAEWSCLEHAQVLVCLGPTAAKTILGPGEKFIDLRGKSSRSAFCEQTIVTWSLSTIQHSLNQTIRARRWQQLVDDLANAASE